MPGNSARRGAVRKGASRKGPQVGSGGQRARALRGKGPTPKASERTAHKASQRDAGGPERAQSGRAQGDRAQGGRGQGGRAQGSRGPGNRSRSGAKGGSEWVAGRNAVVEALRAEVPVTALYVAARIDSDERVREALKTSSARQLPLLEASRADLDRLTGGAVHQGLALQVPAYDYASVEDLLERAGGAGQAPLLVALDGVTDPRNLGAVVRSVAAFGGHGVLVPERRAAGMTASAWKVSAGAAARVPVARATNLRRALQSMQEAGVFVVGLDMDGDVAPRDLQVATDPVCLVVGAEGKGLSRLVRETCDLVASIPMAAQTESLNAGVAAGVALYEIAQQRASR